MKRLRLLGIMIMTIIYTSCQNIELEAKDELNNAKTEIYDFNMIHKIADSVSFGSYSIIDNINLPDSIKNENTTRGGIVSGDEWWVGNKCYIIDGPYAVTRSVTHPAITSPITTGFCGITATVYYNYSRVYEVIDGTPYAAYYTCVRNIERVTTQFLNTSNVYLLWQDGGTRAYCTSSNYDPVLYPQERINVTFEGQIVGEKGFFNHYTPADKTILWTTTFSIPNQ